MRDDTDEPSDQHPLPTLVKPAEVQAVFGNCSASTLGRMVKRGVLTPIRVGRTRYFLRDEIERLISDQLDKRLSRR